MKRQFLIRLVDADAKEHEFGPITLDVPPNELLGWEAVAADEEFATQAAKADLTAAFYIKYYHEPRTV